MNWRGTPFAVALAVLIGALIVLVAAFLVSGQAFLWVGLGVGIGVGCVIAAISGRTRDHEEPTER